MRIIVKGDFPVICFSQLKEYFEVVYTSFGIIVRYEDKEFKFEFDRDYMKPDLQPTLEDCFIGDGLNFLENKAANRALFSISKTAVDNAYYDKSIPVRSAADLFKIIVLLLARFYGDSEKDFSKRLFDFCEKSIGIEGHLDKFDEEKFKEYTSSYLFFCRYFDNLTSY